MSKATRSLRDFFTGRLFLSLLCFVIAATTAFVVLPGLYKSQTATCEVVRVALPVNIGDKIDVRHLEIVEIGAYNLHDSVLASKEDIVGKYARTAMLPGDFVFMGKISDYRVDSTLDHFLAAEQRLVTVTPKNAAQSLSAHLQSGDIVDLAIITDSRQQNGEIMRSISDPSELSNLTIFDVETSRGLSLDRSSESEHHALSSAQSSQEDLVPKTITFVVSDAQAAALIQAEYGGGLHVIFKDRRP